MDSKDNKHVRIDKWLWAVRVFKTRTMAANACKKSNVFINGNSVKPSYIIKMDEVIEVKSSLLTRTFKVIGLLEKRVSASLAVNYVKETTPAEEFKKLKAIKDAQPPGFREKGSGRPTKKDRRRIQRLKPGNTLFII
jgi:ribosome-associated heat shock protein Hsp15